MPRIQSKEAPAADYSLIEEALKFKKCAIPEDANITLDTVLACFDADKNKSLAPSELPLENSQFATLKYLLRRHNFPIQERPHHSALRSAGWTVAAEDKDGVRIEKKAVPYGKSELTALSGTAKGLQFTPDQFVKAVFDVKGYVGKVNYVEDIQVFDKQPEKRIVYGQYLNITFPIADRYHVLDLKLAKKTADEVVIEWKLDCGGDTKEACVGEAGDFVKKYEDDAYYNPLNDGFWTYKKQPDGTWSLTQTLLVHPSGWTDSAGTLGALAANVNGMAKIAASK